MQPIHINFPSPSVITLKTYRSSETCFKTFAPLIVSIYELTIHALTNNVFNFYSKEVAPGQLLHLAPRLSDDKVLLLLFLLVVVLVVGGLLPPLSRYQPSSNLNI